MTLRVTVAHRRAVSVSVSPVPVPQPVLSVPTSASTTPAHFVRGDSGGGRVCKLARRPVHHRIIALVRCAIDFDGSHSGRKAGRSVTIAATGRPFVERSSLRRN
ncbi:hypothetical protein ZOD2009_04632 [Haladaptatus paucihalophilus DX253]|uniref:Uncharacterized protein n=1 Tax=Haladaptatus paucihalophilus DX253 TaxID=797209 RepID=E7QQ56_HALPU|nr:hypothetical protein [Haladaptatus paucihalophilus]EFW93120.1 hypothetical protein ZOD2009_04632 [Haladaptatus paucihalophilus DX253]